MFYLQELRDPDIHLLPEVLPLCSSGRQLNLASELVLDGKVPEGTGRVHKKASSRISSTVHWAQVTPAHAMCCQRTGGHRGIHLCSHHKSRLLCYSERRQLLLCCTERIVCCFVCSEGKQFVMFCTRQLLLLHAHFTAQRLQAGHIVLRAWHARHALQHVECRKSMHPKVQSKGKPSATCMAMAMSAWSPRMRSFSSPASSTSLLTSSLCRSLASSMMRARSRALVAAAYSNCTVRVAAGRSRHDVPCRHVHNPTRQVAPFDTGYQTISPGADAAAR